MNWPLSDTVISSTENDGATIVDTNSNFGKEKMCIPLEVATIMERPSAEKQTAFGSPYFLTGYLNIVRCASTVEYITGLCSPFLSTAPAATMRPAGSIAILVVVSLRL